MDFKSKQVILDMIFSKRLLLPIGFLVLLNLSSCSQDEEDPFTAGQTPAPAYAYTAKINGKSWSGKQNLSLLVKNSLGSPSKEMRISANSSDGKLLTLTLEDASTGVAGDGIAVKTYRMVISGTSDAAFVYVDTQNGSTYEGAYGIVTITKSETTQKKLTGTFDCTLYKSAGDSLKITNGILTDLPYDITEQ
jgi:hypothetical protein